MICFADRVRVSCNLEPVLSSSVSLTAQSSDSVTVRAAIPGFNKNKYDSFRSISVSYSAIKDDWRPFQNGLKTGSEHYARSKANYIFE